MPALPPARHAYKECPVSFQRLAAIATIFLGASVAWAILGTSVVARTGEFDGRLKQDVQLLWGAPHRQLAPQAWIQRPGVPQTVPVAVDSTRATADLALEHRRRGLLWYATYTVTFTATYRFRNPDDQAREFGVRFPFPAKDALFDNVVFAIDGRAAAPAVDVAQELSATTTAAPGAVVTLDVRYTSRGLGTWTYAFADTGVAQVRGFNLVVRTNVPQIDFPAGSMSPAAKSQTLGGWSLTWAFDNLISGQTIGIRLPEKLNPGPLASRITFFAPVSLLFFLAVMVILGMTSGPPLHPMHYWFIAAAFFAFHLLLAYLVDHVTIHVAFAASAFVSVALVVSYLRLVTGIRHALLHAGVTQVVFLVMFSYAFFFEGFTGLTITVGAIATLFVLMQMTARVSWDEVFSAAGRGRRTTEAEAARGTQR